MRPIHAKILDWFTEYPKATRSMIAERVDGVNTPRNAGTYLYELYKKGWLKREKSDEYSDKRVWTYSLNRDLKRGRKLDFDDIVKNYGSFRNYALSMAEKQVKKLREKL